MLNNLPLLSLLSEEERAALAPAVQRRSFGSRSLIVRAGESADGLYVILSGRVHTYVECGEARQFLVSILGPHDFFGETALFEAAPCPVSVESQEACELLYIPRKRLAECLQHNAGAAVFMLRTAFARINELHCKLEGLALMDVCGRVSRVLLEAGHEADGEWRVDLGTEQIATMVGASREMVSRVLKGMTANGALRRERRRLIVLDRGGIENRVRADTRGSVSRARWTTPADAGEPRAESR